MPLSSEIIICMLGKMRHLKANKLLSIKLLIVEKKKKDVSSRKPPLCNLEEDKNDHRLKKITLLIAHHYWKSAVTFLTYRSQSSMNDKLQSCQRHVTVTHVIH